MKNRSFRILKGQHDRGELAIAVPEVILREVPNLFSKAVAKASDDAAKQVARLNDLGISVPAHQSPDIPRERQAFEQALRNELDQIGARTPDLPGIDVPSLLDRAIAGTRPFQEGGKGFKDALIWLTVLELAADDDVALITANWRDFATSKIKKTELHEDLRAELASAGLSQDRVQLFEHLADFIAQEVPASVTKALDLLAFGTAGHEELITEASEALLSLELESWDDSVTIVDGYTQAEIDNISVDDATVESIDVISAWPTDEEGVASVEAVVHAEMYFSFVSDDHGAEWLIDENHDIDLIVQEETFSQFVTLARPVAVTYWLNVELGSGNVSDLEKVKAVDDPSG